MKEFCMNPNDSMLSGFTRRQTLLALMSAAGLSACGGGGDGGPSVGGVGSFSVGPIEKFGSIFVNGIRYEDSSASISSDDSAFQRGDLRVGMMVAVQGTPVVAGQSIANRIVVSGELVGPITSIGIGEMVVLGQTVTISGSTVFAGGNFASLTTGNVVEVHGVADAATNSIKATYVEKKLQASEYRLQGRVTAHDANTKTFSIGSLQLNYTNTAPDRVRITPTEGALVRVRLDTTANAGVYPVKRVRKPEDAFSGFTNAEVEFKGTITAFASLTSFSVNDVPVSVASVSNSTYPEGQIGIAAGAYVEVKGSLVNGAVVATRVKREDRIALAGVGS